MALIDRGSIRAEFAKDRATFHALLDAASEEELARPSDGTRWTNRQLLFHMMFGYLVVRNLLPVVKVVSRLPNRVGRAFAAVLTTATVPFDIVNYWGSCAGSRFYRPAPRMGRRFDAVIASLERRLAAEDEASLQRSMAFPTRWDPFFKDRMTVADLYRYPTQHFDFHERQLTLGGS
jgi:hypothetical protein